MKVPSLPTAASAVAVGVLLTMLTNCGGADITFGGGGGDNNTKVTFKGNLDSISPVTSRDIVVFVYSVDNDSDRCPCPADPSASLVGKAAVLSSGELEFTIAGLAPGTFGVVFLLDKAGSSADGQIDGDDQIAILDDTDCQLDNVKGNLTVTLKNVDLRFSVPPDDDCESGSVGPPEQGRARAEVITFKTTPATT